MRIVVEQNRRSVNVNEAERWASMIGGGALLLYGLKRRSFGGMALALLGGEFMYRGASGHCHLYEALGLRTAKKSPAVSVPYGKGIRVERAVTINKSPEDLYAFWRNFENLPRFMQHLESVKVLDDKRSHWKAKGPAGQSVKWDAEIINEIPNERIGWRSLEGAHVDHAGSVQFKRAPGGRGTEVKVTLEYRPPHSVSLVRELSGKGVYYAKSGKYCETPHPPYAGSHPYWALDFFYRLRFRLLHRARKQPLERYGLL